MEIKDIEANQGKVDIVATVVSKDEARTFEKFGKEGKVCNAQLKDETGSVKLTLWNDDVDKVNVGDKIHVQNGWCGEYKGEKQLSSGKFGSIEVVGADDPGVLTNDEGVLAQEVTRERDGMGDDVERVDEEEEVF